MRLCECIYVCMSVYVSACVYVSVCVCVTNESLIGKPVNLQDHRHHTSGYTTEGNVFPL